MKKIFLISAVILTLFLTGCYNQVVCNEPYIYSGSQCCLDQNKNKVCDKDEYNSSAVTTHTLMEIQKTLSTILGKDILLEKNKTYDDIQFYTGSELRFVPISSCMSGCSGLTYVKRLEFDQASVGYLLDKNVTKEDFYNFISGKKNFFLSTTESIRNDYENELNSSDGLNRFFQKLDYKEYPFKNFTIDKNELYDNFTLLNTISEDSAVEYTYASINDYRIKYGSKKIAGFDDRKERMLEFTHSISIYCRPDLIFVLYGDNYDWRVRINKDITAEDVNNQIEVNRDSLLPKAKILLDLCINKYSYGEFSIE